MGLSLITHQNSLFFARTGSDFPFSSVAVLVRGIFDLRQDHSFFILRNRILTTEPQSAYAHGLVKVTGKRISFDQPSALLEKLILDHPVETGDSSMMEIIEARSHSEVVGLPLKTKAIEIAANSFRSSSFFVEPSWQSSTALSKLLTKNFIFKDLSTIQSCLIEMQSLLPRNEKLHTNPFPVACVITDQDGKVLSWGFNSSSVNRTLHAEVSAVTRFYNETQQKLPVKAKIFVTHKPCQMCAGFLHDFSVDPTSLEIFYLNKETGCRSNKTVLDSQGQHWRL